MQGYAIALAQSGLESRPTAALNSPATGADFFIRKESERFFELNEGLTKAFLTFDADGKTCLG